MTSPPRGRRRMAALEARRFAAARLFARGMAQAVVMRRLAVSRQTAHRWYHLWRRRGREGLKAVGRLGRKPRLDARQLARVERALRRGPQHYGFSTELWTLPRVATARAPGARAGRTGHWAMGGRALADPKKNARRRHAWLVFEDESGVSQQPVIRRTWAPRGKTPVLTHTGGAWQRLSVAGALAFRWDGRRSRFYFQTCPGTYSAGPLIRFLRQLKRHFRGGRVILIWDGLGAHTSRAMRASLARQRRWLHVERLPGFARVRRPSELAFAFLRHTGLQL